jgi:hypothetical protein
MVSKKEAFKLGFCRKLAEAGVDPSSLVDSACKYAAATAAIPVGAAGAGVLAVPAAVGLAGSLVGTSATLPYAAGSQGGRFLSSLVDYEVPSDKHLSKEYLLLKYRELLKRRQAEEEWKTITKAKKQKDDDE